MRIIGPASATRDTVLANLPDTTHPRFRNDMLPELWQAAMIYDIDPVGVVAQSYKETGGGTFRGQVKPEFYNPCGLKIRSVGILPGTEGDEPLAHSMFANWEVGAHAQVQHLRAYAGWPVPFRMIVDPRYVWVIGKHRCENWADLGGKWAPSQTYGLEIEDLMKKFSKKA